MVEHATTDELLARASDGDDEARERLLAQHRDRLRQMIAVRLDRRIAARIDPSDVVQEALLEASRKMSAYLREQTIPFYPWLRQIAWEKLMKLHQQHMRVQKRSVGRERGSRFFLPDDSVLTLAQCLIAPGLSPSKQAQQEEQRRRVRIGLADLSDRDREVLVLRFLEQLSIQEVAAVLDLTPGAVKLRQLRALERLHQLIGDEEE